MRVRKSQIEVEFCTDVVRLIRTKLKRKTPLLSFPWLVAVAEFDAASIRTEILYKKTRNTPGNFDGSEVFIKAFPKSAH